MKKFIIALFVSITFFTGALIALADNVGGGIWNYGVGITGSFSDYLHSGKIHSSSVKYGKSEIDSSKVSPGCWAKSRLVRYHGCNFYWNVY